MKADKTQALENCAAWHYAKSERYQETRERHETIADDLMWRAYQLRQQVSERAAA